MIYWCLLVVCAVMIGATWVALTKPGTADNLIKYGQGDEEQ